MFERRIFNQLVKVVCIVLTSLFNSAAIIASQGSTLFLVSQIKYPGYPQFNQSCPPGKDGCAKFTKERVYSDSSTAWMWCLLGAVLFPELLTLLKSGFKAWTQKTSQPPLHHFLVPLFFQTIHSIGISILFLIALPGMTVVKMTLVFSSVCVLPGLFKVFSDRREQGTIKGILYKAMDVLSLGVQVSAIGLWTIYSDDHSNVWSLSVGLLMTSFGWWEAYLPYDNAALFQGFFDFLRNVRDKSLHKTRQHVINTVVSLWKIVVFIVCFLVISSNLKQAPLRSLFEDIKTTYAVTDVNYVIPGRPPPIPLNETFINCGKTKFIPFLTQPDSADCSAFWIRECGKDEPTLAYNLCPSDMRYFASENSIRCFNEGSCCVPAQEADCSGRTEYSGCVNPSHTVTVKYTSNPEQFPDWHAKVGQTDQKYWPILALLVQIVSTLIAYELSYFAFETRIEITGFALPMTVAPIAAIFTLRFLCQQYLTDSCYFQNLVPLSTVFNCADEKLSDNWFFILTFLSQMWITIHIWTARSMKLAKAEMIFDTPFYDSLMIQQSLLLNRRMDDEKKTFVEQAAQSVRKKASVKACATMWHETVEEMSALIDSILRVDEHNMSKLESDEDYFHFDAHIFFDNAFHDGGHVNVYVQNLIEVFRSRKMLVAEKYAVPYGGRLVWELPGGTKVTCHLKDKTKIRIKKRWSQLMYFTYFLGNERMENLQTGSKKRDQGETFQDIEARKTYILALDGDVRFEANAIVKLVDLMKRDENIGSVCGRIHPVGQGLISMYQKFEYAVGHWLQKTTENVLGNVLCSPGCFSLIRLSSLIECPSGTKVSALEAFAAETTSAADRIQHDQGEDRWLCTLLIERGWRVDYSALSDSYTACPESFGEFYNQRRRWTPSTVANLIHLLNNWQSLLRLGNLSIFHMIYQVLMLTGSAIGPGSIFILLVGGCQMTFNITYWTSFIVNLVPILIFATVSLTASSKTQIMCAKALSLMYGLCMMAIVFALLFSISESCPWAPSTVSLGLTAGAFLFVGLLHPQEFHYLLYGVVYYLTIPCMYMLLPFYCVFNLDDVTWGTREAFSQLPENSTFVDKLRFVFNPHEEIQELQKTVRYEMQQLRQSLEDQKGLEVPKDGKDATDGGSRTNWMENLAGEECHISGEEEKFWHSTLEKYLYPILKTTDQEAGIKEGLVSLRNEVFLIFLFLNAGWAFGIFLLQLSSLETKAFTMDWILCEITPLNTTIADELGPEYLPLDPINFIFILFFITVLLIQVIGMVLHRIGTVGHVVASTSILPDKANSWLDNIHHNDISSVDGVASEAIENGITNPVLSLDMSMLNLEMENKRMDMDYIEEVLAGNQPTNIKESNIEK